jgi:uncharacterized protein YyaL (SSP411 family)
MANRLANETSPYLLQHKNNPVDWYAWSDAAFAAARAADKPVLLSVGYSACHWCHVMAHESFEDDAIAARMNEGFVNIKVDREERPDVDNIYMQAVQALTGRGGWPMTVFLTPEGVPFYGGTYFPPQDRGGMPGFPRVLHAVLEAYRTKRGDIDRAGSQLLSQLSAPARLQSAGDSAPGLDASVLDEAAEAALRAHDDHRGGFGPAPKFPQPMTLDFLMRWSRRSGRPEAFQAVNTTLQAMARGGMYDQVGGGFHRYSTDADWLVPHFEKMLYDNALLARVYLDAFKLTGDPLYRRITQETLGYVQGEMTHSSHGFFSSQDADSEGEEGKFFLWTPMELKEVLNEDADSVAAYYGVTEAGNFEGSNILHISTANALEPMSGSTAPRQSSPPLSSQGEGQGVRSFDTLLHEAKSKLYAARRHRVHPGRDEKVLTAWNGLMLRAFAEAAIAFDSQSYRDTATANADFLLREMRPNGRLLRTWKEGEARLNGYLEDYACLIDGLIAVHAATFDLRYLTGANELANEMIDLCWDDGVQGFFDTGRDHEALVTRPRDFFDNATPSGTSVAIDVLLRLSVLTDNQDYERRALTCLRTLTPFVQQAPTAFGRLLSALDFHLSRRQELAIVLISSQGPGGREGEGLPQDVQTGKPADAQESSGALPLEDAVRGEPVEPRMSTDRSGGLVAEARELLDPARLLYAPNLLLLGAPEGQGADFTPLLADRPTLEGKPTAYLCEGYVCQAPTTDSQELARQLAAALTQT